MSAIAQHPPIRTLVAAFSAAAKHNLTAAGWRKRSGDIYTRELDPGWSAWLGLNRATKYYPMRVHPVAGVRHDATMRLIDELIMLKPSRSPTLSEPVRSLGGAAAGDLIIDSVEGANKAAEGLVGLAEKYALPFAAALTTPEAMLDALRERRHLPVRDYALFRAPALLATLGRIAEALQALNEGEAELANRTDPAAEQYRGFASALRSRLVR